MIYGKKDEIEEVVIADCMCGCGEAIQITHLKLSDELIGDDEYYLSLKTDKFYAQQTSIFKLIFHRIKLAILMLLGKEYRLNNIILTKEQFEEFKQKINKM